jgi:predicted metal-dependent hydrolase
MLIEMSDFSVTLQRKRIKNINLRIGTTGEVRLSAPLRMPLPIIYNFLHQKSSWIVLHRQRLLKAEPTQDLLFGDYVRFQGKSYQLHCHETKTNQRMELRDNLLHLYIKSDACHAYKQKFLTQWYFSQMQQCLPPLFKKWESAIGVSVNKISIKHMKSRWGSCHPIKKHITLNLRLIEKPVNCLEYVIVHELVHLLEASHNQRFYALMDHYLPNWNQSKKQLT